MRDKDMNLIEIKIVIVPYAIKLFHTKALLNRAILLS
jgi:hypothetical protein